MFSLSRNQKKPKIHIYGLGSRPVACHLEKHLLQKKYAALLLGNGEIQLGAGCEKRLFDDVKSMCQGRVLILRNGFFRQLSSSPVMPIPLRLWHSLIFSH